MFFRRSGNKKTKKIADKVKILLVDDELDFVQLVRDRLEKNDYEVITACNGMEGLKKARKEKPDVILLDVIMPIMDGYEMLETLRKQPGGDFSSVIMLTGQSQTYDFARAHTYGADDYIVKPFEQIELLKKIRDAVESRKAAAKLT